MRDKMTRRGCCLMKRIKAVDECEDNQDKNSTQYPGRKNSNNSNMHLNAKK